MALDVNTSLSNKKNFSNRKRKITQNLFYKENNNNYYYAHFKRHSAGAFAHEITLRYKGEIFFKAYGAPWSVYLVYPLLPPSREFHNEYTKLANFLIKEFKIPEGERFWQESEIYCKLHVDYVDLSTLICQMTPYIA